MKIPFRRACGLFACVSFLPFTAFAAAGPAALDGDETIIVTGSKLQKFGVKSGIPIDQMPQSIQVITAGDLSLPGVRSLEDALRVVPSSTVAHNRVSGFGGNTLRIRGFAAQQIRNGIYQRFYDGTDPSAISNIDRIEVLKGPSAVLFGQSGLGGIVSIITKQPTETLTGSVAVTGGSYDQKLATIDIGGPVTTSFGYRLTGEIERSGSFVNEMDVERENIGAAVAWRPDADVSAHLVLEYLHRKTLENPGLPTIGTVISNGIATVDRSAYLGEPAFSLQENHAPLVQAWVDIKLSESWTLTPRFQYSEWNNISRSTTLLPPDPGNPTLIPRVGRNAGEKDHFYVAQLDLAGDVALFGTRHQILAGAEYNDDSVPFRMESTLPCGIGPIDVLNPTYGCGAPTGNFGFLAEAKLEGYALYFQDQIKLTNAWSVIAGVRHARSVNDNSFVTDVFSTFNSADLSNTSWQLGTTYDLGGGLSVFGGYNTGYDLGAVTGSRRFDGTPFEPETSDQAELGVRLAGETLRASLSVFRIHRNNVAVPDPANFGFQLQEGQFRVQGLELQGAWSPVENWVIEGGYAYLDGEISRTTDLALLGADLAETPRHSATLSVRATLGEFDVRAGIAYVGERKMINGGTVTLPDYATVDLGVGTTLGPVRVEAALTNVFDETYYFTDNASRYSLGTEDRVLPGEPRNVSLRLSYHFGEAS
jgi:iron complex outermembrane receptor protein